MFPLYNLLFNAYFMLFTILFIFHYYPLVNYHLVESACKQNFISVLIILSLTGGKNYQSL